VSNYPPGVTGSEYVIAGPDYERESDTTCPTCGKLTLEQGYHEERWLICVEVDGCGMTHSLEPVEDDPDRRYDEARERRLSDEDWDA